MEYHIFYVLLWSHPVQLIAHPGAENEVIYTVAENVEPSHWSTLEYTQKCGETEVHIFIVVSTLHLVHCSDAPPAMHRLTGERLRESTTGQKYSNVSTSGNPGPAKRMNWC